MGASRQPSDNSNVTGALDELLVIITGSAEKEEHMLKQISSKLNKSTLGKIVSEAAAPQIEFLSAAANMLTAIAGYLFGEKGVSLNTPASQLLGKIKNNAPILGEKSFEQILVEDNNKTRNTNESAELNFIITLEGIAGNDLYALCDAIKLLKESAGVDDIVELDTITDLVKLLQTVSNEISKVNFTPFSDDFANSILNFDKSIESITIVNNRLLKNLPTILILSAFEADITKFPKILAELISGNNGKGGLVMIMNRFNKAQENGLDPKILTSFFENVFDLVKVLTKVGIISIIAGAVTQNISKTFDKLKEVIEALSTLDIKAVVKCNKSIENAAKLVNAMRDIFVGLAIVGILALPAMLGLSIILVASKMIFKVVEIVSKGLKDAKDIQLATENLKGIGILILTLGLLLIFAALTGGWVLENAGNILGFAGVLMLFIAIIMLPFTIYSKFLSTAIKSAEDIALLIVTCALVMMLGALFMKTGLWLEAIGFGIVLAIFTFLVLLPFVIYSTFLPKALNSAKDIALLIVTCALVMMLGAFFMLSGLWLEALGFGIILTLFIFGVMSPFILFSKNAKDISKSIKAITALVITCTIVLIIGAFFMLSGLWLEAIGFALILSSFIWLVSLPFLLWGKNLMKAGPAMFALALIVVVSSIILMVGANFIYEYGATDIILFAVILSSFVAIIATICFVISKAVTDILKGAGVMAVILVVVILGALAMRLIADASTIADPLQVLATVGILTLIILGIAGISLGLGFLASGPLAPFFWAGIGAVAAIAGIALILSISIKNIAEAVKIIVDLAKDGPIDISGVMTILGAIPAIGAAVGSAGMALLPLMPIITLTSITCLSMAAMISKLGIAVADIANLKVAEEYDSKGNPTKFIQLSTKHFDMAAQGVSTIITTIGAAIGKVYKEHKELFGIFSPVTKVIDAATDMSVMISKLGKSVAEISNLKVAEKWDSKGNPIKYIQLNKSHFEAAGENVSLILTTIGQALEDEYKNHPLMYMKPLKFSLFGGIRQDPDAESPIERVVNTGTQIGEMMSSLAHGVADMADLKIADKWDKNGKPTHYVYLKSKDIILAGLHTGIIIRTMGEALTAEFKAHPLMYAKPLKFSLFGGVSEDRNAETPVERVINTATQLGEMMSSLARGLVDMADMKVADKWDKNGKPTHYIKLTQPDIKQVAVNVGNIVKVLAESLIKLYKDHPGYFENFWGNASKSPIAKVIKSTEGLGSLISDVAKGLKDVADLSFKDADGKVIKIKDTDLGKDGLIYKRIVGLFTIFGGAIDSISKNPVFEDFEDNIKELKKPMSDAPKLVVSAADMVKDIDKAFKDIDAKKTMEVWEQCVIGIFKSFNTEISNEAITKLQNGSKTDFEKFSSLITSVNSLDTAKADKFIELTRELKDLSLSVGDMRDFVNALNGRINETLSTLSTKLEYASESIKESDKAQDKRQKLIEKNTKKLEKVLDKPMKVELSKATPSGSGSSSKSGGSSSNSTETTPAAGGNGGGSFDSEALASAINKLVEWLNNH